jgi:hypothetical protein
MAEADDWERDNALVKFRNEGKDAQLSKSTSNQR